MSHHPNSFMKHTLLLLRIRNTSKILLTPHRKTRHVSQSVSAMFSQESMPTSIRIILMGTDENHHLSPTYALYGVLELMGYKPLACQHWSEKTQYRHCLY
jgi:hypothetical protein